jgi:hypothetical protein
MNYLAFRQFIKGSNPVVCAREGGANTTPFQVAHFALRNTKNKTGEKKTSNRAKPEKQKGKKEGGLGEGIFARLLTAPKARLGWERFRLSALAEGQNRNIFFSLVEKNFGGARIKKCRENVSVLLAVAKRRRAETLSGIQSKSACGFSLKKVRISFRVRSRIGQQSPECFSGFCFVIL